MLAKRIGLILVVVLVLVLSASTVLAQGGGRPDGKGPPDDKGGGPPVGTMVDRAGPAYFDSELGVWRVNDPDDLCTDRAGVIGDGSWVIDFGPEGYCPDPCLTGDLITDELNGTDEVTIRIGKNVVGTFTCTDSACTTILAETVEGGPAPQFIPLTPAMDTNYGRPKEGKWTRVYGRAGETECAILAWEVKYPWLPNSYENWYWWRSTGQPWAKMQLLDCDSPGE